jgi:hypothetical protein
VWKPQILLSGSTVYVFNLCVLLTNPWNWVLLEKPTVAQPLQKFPTSYGTQRFTTVFTGPRHRSHAEPDESSPYPDPIFIIFILILSSYLRLGHLGGLFASGFPTKTLYSLVSHAYMLSPSHPPWTDQYIGEKYNSWSSSLCSFFEPPTIPFRSKYSPQHILLKYIQRVLLSRLKSVFINFIAHITI